MKEKKINDGHVFSNRVAKAKVKIKARLVPISSNLREALDDPTPRQRECIERRMQEGGTE